MYSRYRAIIAMLQRDRRAAGLTQSDLARALGTAKLLSRAA
jgi:transcriptional regulator with XRE-family HTH domain